MFDPIIEFATSILAALTELITPFAGPNAAALAIILLTCGVRLLLLPLSLAAARGERARARLAPRIQRLHERYRRDPERLRRELAALYAAEGTTPLAGCLPSLAQTPFFILVYQVASAPSTHTLFGAPLGQPLAAVVAVSGPFSVPVLVFAVLLTLLTVVAWTASRRARLMAAAAPQTPAGEASLETVRKLTPLLPYGAVAAGAVLPLGAGLYLLASTTWTMLERVLLYPKPTAVQA
ncbi:membrane protein insertase YidC [Thermostaphylospora chromogena]|uniref:Membrane protein insertase YidC n=1 Tax=Thermostaphylospora chromogena TaxID=35622 RepID=A0A1H1CWM5_9ACTN|nr:membrane protein insertase YidC [Thermostaphylospora chromogena]SDQ67966.1 YidC/Oxa1 family membrane protein insertase [Thermostaphylospora chromogena]